MTDYKLFNDKNKPSSTEKNTIIEFLFHHLENFGGRKEDIEKAIETADGNIALHVEPDNPARYLYEKLGFTNKYLEMRYVKQRN